MSEDEVFGFFSFFAFFVCFKHRLYLNCFDSHIKYLVKRKRLQEQETKL